MKKKISLCFAVNGNEEIGLGHLSRRRALMLALLKTAECSIFVFGDNKKVIRKFLLGIHFKFYNINGTQNKRRFDIAVVDIPEIKGQDIECLRKSSQLLVCIDDDGPGTLLEDILIRPNILNLQKSSAMCVSADNYWSGRDYVILHPDFEAAVRRKRKIGKIKKLMVCFGGSDMKKLTLKAIPILEKLGADVKIHIVLGAAFPWGKEVNAETRNDPRFIVNDNIQNMAKVVYWADAALISGGTLLYEICSLGIPAVVISQNPAQAKEAAMCQRAGAVLSLGVSGRASDTKVLASLKKVLEDGSLRKIMSKQGPKLVRSDGAMLIARKLLSLIDERN